MEFYIYSAPWIYIYTDIEVFIIRMKLKFYMKTFGRLAGGKKSNNHEREQIL